MTLRAVMVHAVSSCRATVCSLSFGRTRRRTQAIACTERVRPPGSLRSSRSSLRQTTSTSTTIKVSFYHSTCNMYYHYYRCSKGVLFGIHSRVHLDFISYTTCHLCFISSCFRLLLPFSLHLFSRI